MDSIQTFKDAAAQSQHPEPLITLWTYCTTSSQQKCKSNNSRYNNGNIKHSRSTSADEQLRDFT